MMTALSKHEKLNLKNASIVATPTLTLWNGSVIEEIHHVSVPHTTCTSQDTKTGRLLSWKTALSTQHQKAQT